MIAERGKGSFHGCYITTGVKRRSQVPLRVFMKKGRSRSASIEVVQRRERGARKTGGRGRDTSLKGERSESLPDRRMDWMETILVARCKHAGGGKRIQVPWLVREV